MRPAVCKLLLLTALGPTGYVSAQPEGPSLDIYLTIASDYLNRGASQTDGEPALQVGLDYRHRSGLFAGAWLSNVEFATEALRTKPRRSELDYYVGYSADHEEWSWALTLANYRYPNIYVSYDYSELSVSVSVKERFHYQASHTNDLLAQGRNALNQEIGLTLPFYRNFEFGAAVGLFRSSDISGDHYTHFNLGVSKVWRRWTGDMRYYDTNYPRRTHLGDPAERRWVLSLSYGFSPL